MSQRVKEKQPRSNQELLIVVRLLDTVIVLQLQIIVKISFYHVVRAAILASEASSETPVNLPTILPFQGCFVHAAT